MVITISHRTDSLVSKQTFVTGMIHKTCICSIEDKQASNLGSSSDNYEILIAERRQEKTESKEMNILDLLFGHSGCCFEGVMVTCFGTHMRSIC